MGNGHHVPGGWSAGWTFDCGHPWEHGEPRYDKRGWATFACPCGHDAATARPEPPGKSRGPVRDSDDDRDRCEHCLSSFGPDRQRHERGDCLNLENWTPKYVGSAEHKLAAKRSAERRAQRVAHRNAGLAEHNLWCAICPDLETTSADEWFTAHGVDIPYAGEPLSDNLKPFSEFVGETDEGDPLNADELLVDAGDGMAEFYHRRQQQVVMPRSVKCGLKSMDVSARQGFCKRHGHVKILKKGRNRDGSQRWECSGANNTRQRKKDYVAQVGEQPDYPRRSRRCKTCGCYLNHTNTSDFCAAHTILKFIDSLCGVVEHEGVWKWQIPVP